MKRIAISTLALLLISLLGLTQGVYAPLNADYYHLIDRYEIRSNKFADNIFTGFKPILRKDIARLADTVEATQILSKVDRYNIRYLKFDNWEHYEDSLRVGSGMGRVSKTFFQKYNAVYSHNSENFNLVINPVVDFEQSSYNKKYFMSLNTRGIELRGLIGKRVGFYTYMSDNQAFSPDYVKQKADSAGAFPGEGFTKNFKNGGYDFFSVRGYITFNIIKQIGVQFGHDKNFIGNGYRSLILSDYSSKYLFLKITTKVWKFNYTNLFTEMTGKVINGDNYNPRKYMAMHHFSLNVTKNFNIGVFEAIAFGRSDSATGNSGFELNYLNPIIFYREVESYLGSKDKSEVGADFKWNFARHFSLYGQFVLNEFKLSNVAKQNGWWGNKYAWQIGLKYIDVFGIKNLDLQLEHNFVRPYMYSDKNPLTSFSNYGQPIAHPMGANFYEFLGIIRCQPLRRFNIIGKAFYIVYGQDPPGMNYGGNIMKPGYTPVQQYGNEVGQGIETTTLFASLTVNYQLFHNFFIDVRQTLRREKSNLGEVNDNFTTVGLRWNVAQRLQEF